MARSINDVDFVIVIINRGLLGSDSDAALVFLVHGIHDQSLRHFRLIITKSARLFQKTIDQGSFAMVDVSNNCNVADVCNVHLSIVSQIDKKVNTF